MSIYIIPGNYDKCVANFICSDLMYKALEVFNLKESGIDISVVPVNYDTNTIPMFASYKIIVKSNDCISSDFLKTWATQTIVNECFNREVINTNRHRGL